MKTVKAITKWNIEQLLSPMFWIVVLSIIAVVATFSDVM